MFPITSEEVEAAVQQYWALFGAKDSEQQQGFYTAEAMLFTCSSKRIERACIVCMQRRREHQAKSPSVRIRISNVDVIALGSEAAVAMYTLQLRSERIPAGATVSKRQDDELFDARVTQIFRRDENSELKIVHEHMSAAQDQTAGLISNGAAAGL